MYVFLEKHLNPFPKTCTCFFYLFLSLAGQTEFSTYYLYVHPFEKP